MVTADGATADGWSCALTTIVMLILCSPKNRPYSNWRNCIVGTLFTRFVNGNNLAPLALKLFWSILESVLKLLIACLEIVLDLLTDLQLQQRNQKESVDPTLLGFELKKWWSHRLSKWCIIVHSQFNIRTQNNDIDQHQRTLSGVSCDHWPVRLLIEVTFNNHGS